MPTMNSSFMHQVLLYLFWVQLCFLYVMITLLFFANTINYTGEVMFKTLRTSIWSLVPVINAVTLAIAALFKSMGFGYKEMQLDRDTVYHENVKVVDTIGRESKGQLKGTGHDGAKMIFIFLGTAIFMSFVFVDVVDYMFASVYPILFTLSIVAFMIKLTEDYDVRAALSPDVSSVETESTKAPREQGLLERIFFNTLIVVSFFGAIVFATLLLDDHVFRGFFSFIFVMLLGFIGFILPVTLGFGHIVSYICRVNSWPKKLIAMAIIVLTVFAVFWFDPELVDALIRFYNYPSMKIWDLFL